jgi:LysM repeat protein
MDDNKEKDHSVNQSRRSVLKTALASGVTFLVGERFGSMNTERKKKNEEGSVTPEPEMQTKQIDPDPPLTQEIEKAVEDLLKYEVQAGDSLASVAKKFELPSWHPVFAWNLESMEDERNLRAGQILVIPNKDTLSEEIDYFTPRQEKLSLEKKYFSPWGEEAIVGERFKQFYDKWKDKLGEPIVNEEDHGSYSIQYFENFALISSSDQKESVRVMNIGSQLFVKTIQNDMSDRERLDFYQLSQDDLRLYPEFRQFYEENGGEEFLGRPISPAYNSRSGDITFQWTTNSRIEIDIRTGEIRLGKVGNEIVNEIKFIGEEGKLPPVMTVNEAIEKIRGCPEEAQEDLGARTVILLEFIKNGRKPITKSLSELRDNLIWDNYASDQEVNFNNVHAILSWHEARFELNPALQSAFERMKVGSEVINKMLRENFDPGMFADGKYPSMPEALDHIFVFVGGTKTLGGGGAYFNNPFPIIHGGYDYYFGNNAESDEAVTKALTRAGFHELIHARVQSKSPNRYAWDHKAQEEQNKIISNSIAPVNKPWHLAHMAMCAFTGAVEKNAGLPVDVEPRVVQIYRVLKKVGHENPLREILKAAVFGNGLDLLKACSSAESDEDPSIELLLSENTLTFESLKKLYYPDPAAYEKAKGELLTEFDRYKV